MKREQLKKGDIIEYCGITACVVNPNFVNDYVKVSLIGDTGKTYALINKEWLSAWNLVNPIKNNRIVSDKTFAIRFRDFIKDVKVNDPCSDDEKEYLLNVAERLLKYQINTATEESEINYLKGLELL